MIVKVVNHTCPVGKDDGYPIRLVKSGGVVHEAWIRRVCGLQIGSWFIGAIQVGYTFDLPGTMFPKADYATATRTDTKSDRGDDVNE